MLVVDDERNIRTTVTACLESMGCKTTAVASGAAALRAVERDFFDLVFLDLRLGSENGLDLVPKLLATRLGLTIVVITAYATFDIAVEAMRRGASDFLPKPFTPAQIRHVVEDAMSRRVLLHRISTLEARLEGEVPEASFLTRSSKMREVLDLLSRAAASGAPVLLRGESGTGKGVLARALHAQSPRAERPFVTVNCPTLSEELLTGELFGHAQGAFTGAVRDQPGRVEGAHGGSLFLDEVGEISPGLQAKLLRFIESKQFERIGESTTRRADARVIAATNRDLDADVKAGRFREDLLFRLNVIEILVPPLRERSQDIIPLANGFIAFCAKSAGRSAPTLSPETEAALCAYAWPGNVRELKNVIERALILWPSSILEPGALPSRIATNVTRNPRLGDDFTLEEIEKEHIARIIQRTASLDEAARILGIDASTLWRKRKRYDEPER